MANIIYIFCSRIELFLTFRYHLDSPVSSALRHILRSVAHAGNHVLRVQAFINLSLLSVAEYANVRQTTPKGPGRVLQV